MPPSSPTSAGSDIPVGTQFSPDVINLREFCRAAVHHSGNASALRDATWKSPVRLAPVANAPTRRRASLPLEAATQYGLLTSVVSPTPTAVCEEIAKAPDEDSAYSIFAKHILLNCNGAAFVSMLQTFLADDTQTEVNADAIARYSTRHCGLRIIEHNTAINTLRMFLARAGVFDSSAHSGRKFWTPDIDVVDSLIGSKFETLEDIAALKPHQRAFVHALCTLAEPGVWYDAGNVRDHAESMFPGVLFSRASVVKDVLEALAELNLVEFKTGGTSGGKAAKLRILPDFDARVLTPFLENAAEHVGTASAPFLRVTAEEIRTKLASSNKVEKGLALEALAIRVMRTLDLTFDKWRVRSADAGYAEVDVSFFGVMGGLPTKWQVQCKNTPRSTIGNDELARELGVATVDGATHVLFLANATYTSNAIAYAKRVNKRGPILLYLLDENDVEAMLDDFSHLTRALRKQTKAIVEMWRS